MATLKELFWGVLATDAQSEAEGSLGALMGHATTTPYGVYHIQPPDKPIFPLVTYQIIGAVNRLPRDIYVNIKAWANNYEAILERIYTLLEDQPGLLGAATDFHILELRWNWAGPEVMDEEYQIWHQTHRYRLKGVKL